jgi:hypothetical protein
MKKIVINNCHGGFGLSNEAIQYLDELKNLNLIAVRDTEYRSLDITHWFVGEIGDSNQFYPNDIARDDPDLVRVVEEMGERANSKFAKLKVVEIPDGVEWEIDEYDGCEWIAEKHRRWY